MRTLPPHEQREKRPATIRIHTILNNIKMYDVSDWWIYDNCLGLIGVNVDSKHSGRFYFPLCNIDHFNIDERKNDNMFRL
jgi:hypothetical protein